MKIVFTGGGTGGHFYPIIAIAEAINRITLSEKILKPDLYYLAPTPYDERALFENGIIYRKVRAGKWRPYFSLLNFFDIFNDDSFDIFKNVFGILKAILALFTIYPDVVFGKGGYGSFPTLLAARVLNIPVIIHESDAIPGKVNLWAGKFARAIGVSYREAAKYFPENKVAYTGQPIRHELLTKLKEGAHEFLKLEEGTPVISVIGGSQGAITLNNAVLQMLPTLLNDYQVIHQTGKNNFSEVESATSVILKDHAHKNRYHSFSYLNMLALRMVAGVSSLIISRAGSTLFEIAVWGLPSIVIPIREEVSHDQTANAFAYGRGGAAHVIEEKNATPAVISFEVNRIMKSQELRDKMAKAAEGFAKSDAAEKIAKEMLGVGLTHEQ